MGLQGPTVALFLVSKGTSILFSIVGAPICIPTSNAGDIRDKGSIPESGRFPGGGHGNPL